MLSEVLTDLTPLPKGFEWTEVDIDDDEQAQEVYVLLRDNYVEDDD